MGTYSYTFVSTANPPIPLISVTLKSPRSNSAPSVKCQGILDTGSDCTLVPIPLLAKVRGKPKKGSVRIPFSGQMTLGIPYEVGLVFDSYEHSSFQVFACSVEEMGELLIIGRDLMNHHRIEFNGQALTFTVF
ncbi:MAG: hypothetical protein QNJ60_17420 [Xenococcaceae cyanobacterium MO_188.B19]|nr:hypothetical protein [Xenococcaceae cyanobacterium MO_188.B19]